ncbi:short-chain dehydrogenase/reductase family 42E member 1-like isoform X2 [Mercenaria mercenaria]|uniref:short-chain dehydrogenase/reductase family 42E member 1-like isoform X2 n=1 Tax=Mercenaria mercenaria TaxID=6596 RepID=UPI00234FA58B|nr:short-chain dehydrogenase/reductase family 42E member 1-like isoform X2 [Mercenaria mercenaria]
MVKHGLSTEAKKTLEYMASYGMSGREQLNRRRIEAVNVGGTENVIQACKTNDVTRLVYTSTYNVIFGGQTINDGDESLPYLPLNKQPDHYSRTKSIAEQKVLKADGRKTDSGNTLHTCALRLAAVYGPGEQRHIPRIVDYIEKGLFSIIYETDTLQDFLHVENLAQAHELAGKALTKDKSYVAAGQAYFVSDDAPINTFSFFGPLITGLGYPMPSIRLPISVIYFVAFLTEWLHYLISYVYNFQPLLTRTEVYKTGVTHTFSIKKAGEQLGYRPTIQNDISKVIQHYINTGHKKHTEKEASSIVHWIVNIIIGALIAMLIMSFLPIVK